MRTRKVLIPGEVSDNSLRGFLRIYSLERWMREMVYVELKTSYGTSWWAEAEKAIRRSKGGGISAERSLKADKKHPHMSTAENDPLWFISFDTLLKIILDRKLWKHFETYLTTKALLRAKFDEIAPIRNRIAHVRELHPEDIARLELLLTDLDRGFWKFCTSYNASFYITRAEGTADEISEHICSMQEYRLACSLLASIRPTIRRHGQTSLGRSGIYHLQLGYPVTPTHQCYLDYPEILKWTSKTHSRILHIIMDAFQQSLVVTLPAVIPTSELIPVIDSFMEACANCTHPFPLVRIKKETAIRKRNHLRHYENENAPFERIAAEWPHYVLPPSHPFAFLDPSCPCKFFSTGPCIE